MADNNGNEHLESVSNNEQTDKSIIERPQISWWARLLGGSTLADIMEQADRYLQEATKMRMDVEGENAQLAQTKTAWPHTTKEAGCRLCKTLPHQQRSAPRRAPMPPRPERSICARALPAPPRS